MSAIGNVAAVMIFPSRTTQTVITEETFYGKRKLAQSAR